ncbi:hypothetical protein NBRC10513v2_002767 [Rhodotorula toruloides]|uniref:BY PROTMAP: gi/472585940/gb/EMS23482.1/ Bestrophin/UPF0187 protein [Rhodosporidium toruloides NP11] gi/647395662/emb/CDR37264.1/ RHTO0S02e12706g1_1 [Rhodosporidium toruloides] n=1 Tax=Rhodotorula toruloides TaxID=5286 RepID=A0A0K3CDQ6_RHOTO
MSILLRKIGQTVFPEIAPAVLAFTLVAVAVTVGCEVSGFAMKVNTIMLSVLTTMLSFAVSLRTSSALERWNAGRQAWSTVSLASRNLASMIWIHIGGTTLDAAEQAKIEPGSDADEIEKLKALIEKRTMLNLIQAFAVAVKHYVRGENGVYYEDLYELVKPLPKYSFPSGIDDPSGIRRDVVTGLWRAPLPDGSTCIPMPATSGSATLMVGTMSSSALSSHIDLEKGTFGAEELGELRKEPKIRKVQLLPGHNPPPFSIYDYAPALLVFRPMLRAIVREHRAHKVVASTNIPLEIQLFLHGYITTCIRRGTLAAPLVGVAFGALNQLGDSLAICERVLSTPLPFSYSVHLRATAFVYLLILPFQIYGSLGWLTIPAQFIAACVFWGFLELSRQVEQPFGYDDSDLDLDKYCALIAAELQEIAAHSAPSPSSFTFSPLNTPFGPYDTRSAPEILADFSQTHGGTNQAAVKGVPGMRAFLARSYHDLEERARGEREARKRSKAGSRRNTGDDGRTVEVCTL